MSATGSPKIAGFVLVGAALLGVVAITVFSPKEAMVTTPRTNDTAAAVVPRGEPTVSASIVPVVVPERERIGSPFAGPATDSVAGRCVATVREQLDAAGQDTSGVAIAEWYGVRPPPGRGPDSLVVEGTARGRDSTPAVWHCAATSYPSGAVATLTAVVEDGWPGIAAGFDAAHAVNLAATEACLQRTKPLFPEYVFRGVKYVRRADTLHVTGESIPLNTEDLAGDFHCRGVVRGGSIVDAIAKKGK